MTSDQAVRLDKEIEAILGGSSWYSQDEKDLVEQQYRQALAKSDAKIVVIDDDPTGVQTVHDVSVYTDWTEASIRRGFSEERHLFYILTNSRALQAEETEIVHRTIAERVLRIARELEKDYILISRSDSTLRGHFPLETETLRQVIEQNSARVFAGEIIVPFFPEGGRYTIGNTHYVKEGQSLTPAGETEYARDQSFSYRASHLGRYCEEKTGGRYKADRMIYISLADLRKRDISKISARLSAAAGFNKIIVNATEYTDLKVFTIALMETADKGRQFMFRSAAALPKILGGIEDKPLLGRAELLKNSSGNGGLVVIGSSVSKTSKQLEELRRSSKPLHFIEFNQHLIAMENGLEDEAKRVSREVETVIGSGRTAVVYTRRERFEPDSTDSSFQLRITTRIAQSITDMAADIGIRPGFILAKGGITSSDIGTKALGVRRAEVLGQVKPGIPVWLTGDDSKYPGLPYIIFPGNVGEPGTLREIIEMLL